MLSLFANGAPPYPMPDAPASEWVVWGGCIGVAAVLGGWALINIDRPKRLTLCVLFLLGAFALVPFAGAFAAVRALHREDERYRQQHQEKIERLKREAEEPSQP
jgi:hypothetical protein